MNELFRFAVVRPANVSKSVTCALSPRGGLSTDLQQQLGAITQGTEGDAGTIWTALEGVAVPFVENNVGRVLASPLWSSLDAFPRDVRGDVTAWSALPIDTKAITATFKTAAGQPNLQQYRQWLADLFLALLVVRRGGPAHVDAIIRSAKAWQYAEWLSKTPDLTELGDRLRAINLIAAGVTAVLPPSTVVTIDDARAAAFAALDDAMSRTILLPPALFAPLTKVVHAAGFREFHAVKQHIRRYELEEIARIENILAGETRTHSQTHTLSNETDTTVTTDTTTEKSTELTTTDHVAITNEASQQVKDDTKLDAGVHAQYDGGGSYKLQTDLTLGYENSSDTTKKFSSNVAKDVTQKAVNKITQQIIVTQTKKIIETFQELESQQFQYQGTTNTSGIYQWVQKIYLAQVFNLGRHMLLEIMVPEPGASLLAAAALPPSNVKQPVAPDPLGVWATDAAGNKVFVPLSPDQLDIDSSKPTYFYGTWIAKYQVTGVTPPPPEQIVVAKSLAAKRDDDLGQVLSSDTIKIDDGYEVIKLDIVAAWLHFKPTSGGSPSKVEISVGNHSFHFDEQNHVDGNWGNDYEGAQTFNYGTTAGERSQIPVAVATSWVEHVSANIEVLCKRTEDLLAAWKIATYEKIVAAWQKLESDYQSALDKLAQQATSSGPLGAADPDTNRTNERLELKRSCIAIMDNSNATVRGVTPDVAVADSPDNDPGNPASIWKPVLPEPILGTSQSLGAAVRWFEQAFEWENMAYVLYPYFWGRRTTWVDRLNLPVDDPLFKQFLQAGYARVVVPVRLGFEPAVLFYLNCGMPWLGGGVPILADQAQTPLYLDIADEIRALTGGGELGETAVPIGDPWEYSLPTGLLMLRADATLPEWHRADGLPSDPLPDDWTWADGPPPPPTS
ncbi:hypothetical protein WK60_00285 [Burkholderia ubonensis]|uniref:hypothetical protein n=1 Tax=Burkholderia ubonensis TaxID=101571 RepID=UPI000753C6A6|nr:hypothetical protein [Burkholderia ubonensis]KVT98528.1 hypothetical protein WK60_00285 [Burkholderia ubonensis]